jgi:hypothetical protein
VRSLRGCEPSHISLFRRDGGACDLAGHPTTRSAAALHFGRAELARVVVWRPDARAYFVDATTESELGCDHLGTLPEPALAA